MFLSATACLSYPFPQMMSSEFYLGARLISGGRRRRNPSKKQDTSAKPCIFWTTFLVWFFFLFWVKFLTFDTRKLAQKQNARRLTLMIQILTCGVTCEEEIRMSMDISELQSHVLLGMWHRGDILEGNVDVNGHSFCIWKRHVTLWIWSWTSNEICPTYALRQNIECTLLTNNIGKTLKCL